MSMSDPIADMLARIRNGQASGRDTVIMPTSKIKEAVARVLREEGFIGKCETNIETDGKKTLNLTLRYYDGKPVISRIDRVSRPGKRVYCRSVDIPTVDNGLGTVVVSTSKGIMTGKQAKASQAGGEIICTVS